MSYKSRVTKKYPSASFFGGPSIPRKNELTDLVTALSDVTPKLANIGSEYMKSIKDTATVKMEELYASGKKTEDIQKEILDGVHPELSEKYAQSAVEVQHGKFTAQDTINKIIANQDTYNRYTVTDDDGNVTADAQSFNDFIKPFIPDLSGQSQYYNKAFAATFGKWKAENELKDAEIRSAYWSNHKISQAANYIRNQVITSEEGTNGVISNLESFSIELPKIDGKKNYYLTNDEKNLVLFRTAKNFIDQARTIGDVDIGLAILSLDRGEGVGGNNLGSLASKATDDVNSLINAAWSKRATIIRQDELNRKVENEKLAREATTDYLKALDEGDVAGLDAAVEKIRYIDGGAYLSTLQTIKNNYNLTNFNEIEFERLRIAILNGDIRDFDVLMQEAADAKMNGIAIAQLQSDWNATEAIRAKGEIAMIDKPAWKSLYDIALENVKNTYKVTGPLGQLIDTPESDAIELKYRQEFQLILHDEIEEFKNKNNGKHPSYMERDQMVQDIANSIYGKYANPEKPEAIAKTGTTASITESKQIITPEETRQYEDKLSTVDVEGIKSLLSQDLFDDAGVLRRPVEVGDDPTLEDPTRFVTFNQTVLQPLQNMLASLTDDTITVQTLKTQWETNQVVLRPIFDDLANRLGMPKNDDGSSAGDALARRIIDMINVNPEYFK